MQANIRRVAVLATLAAASAAALAAPQYHVTDLGVGQALVMNQKGDAAGVANAPTSDAVVFHAGKMKRLANLPGGAGGTAHGINDARVSVGTAYEADGTEHAAKWGRDGTLHDLGVSSIGSMTGAYGIDAQGTIIGGDVNEGVFPPQSVSWFIDPQGVRHVFPTMPGGDSSAAGGINPAGQIAGSGNTSPGGVQHCFVYTNGSFKDLGTGPAGEPCSATAISTNGYVGGSIVTAHANIGIVWTGTTLQTVGTLGGPRSDVWGINASGVAVGNSDIAADGKKQHPFAWSAGTMTDLTTVLDSSGTHWSAMYVYGIDDQGRIVGTGRLNGTYHGFMLTPLAN